MLGNHRETAVELLARRMQQGAARSTPAQPAATFHSPTVTFAAVPVPVTDAERTAHDAPILQRVTTALRAGDLVGAATFAEGLQHADTLQQALDTIQAHASAADTRKSAATWAKDQKGMSTT